MCVRVRFFKLVRARVNDSMKRKSSGFTTYIRTTTRVVTTARRAYTSSSFNSMLGTPFVIGNLRPESGHTRYPSWTWTSSNAW